MLYKCNDCLLVLAISEHFSEYFTFTMCVFKHLCVKHHVAFIAMYESEAMFLWFCFLGLQQPGFVPWTPGGGEGSD